LILHILLHELILGSHPTRSKLNAHIEASGADCRLYTYQPSNFWGIIGAEILGCK
jgi:hypothetical protein